MNATRRSAKAPASSSASSEFDSAFWNVIQSHFFSHAHLRQAAEAALVPLQLGLAHHRAMAFIYKNPGITVGQLRCELRVSSQALNTVLGQLIRRELVEQKAGQEDRRIKHLFLTREGKDVLETALGRQRDVVRKAAHACGPDAVKGFIALARAMAEEEARQSIGPVDEAAVVMLCKAGRAS